MLLVFLAWKMGERMHNLQRFMVCTLYWFMVYFYYNQILFRSLTFVQIRSLVGLNFNFRL